MQEIMTIPLLRRKAPDQSNQSSTDHLVEAPLVVDGAPSPPQRQYRLFSTTIVFLLLLSIWCTSTLLSGSVFHVCVSSRKLNLYCISGGTGQQFGLVNALKLNTIVEDSNNATITNGNIKEDEKAKALKVVEHQMQVLRSWSTSSKSKSSVKATISCEGRGIFVYDLPTKFNYDLLGYCHELLPWANLCDYFANDAMGEQIPSLGNGWHRTHQYTLEPIFHQRVMRHPCRVYSPDDAKLFYVPFYGGLDVLRWNFNNVSNDVKDSLGLELIQWLENQKPWVENQGKDHMFVLGKISWDFRRRSDDYWGSNFLDLEKMKNPYKFLIERHPWEMNDIGIPHPTHFHPHSDADIESWQAKLISHPRKNLVGYAAAARPEAAENVRSILIDQCKYSSNGNCSFLDCKSDACLDPETVVGVFLDSEFCLQPPGDSPTRKSVFDSLVAGCIPVLFDPFTAYYQYPWHLPEERRKYSVFVEKEEVMGRRVDVVERLRNVSVEEREEMRKYIVYEVLPGLVYGDSTSEFHRFRDAFGIVMDNVMVGVTKPSNVIAVNS